MAKELIFVYNASSGLFSSLTDSVHKALSPKTYQCNLCALTWGLINEKSEWKNFISSLKIRSTFLHKDQFAEQYPNQQNTTLPAIFINDNKLTVLITAEELNKQKTLQDLMNLVKTKLN